MWLIQLNSLNNKLIPVKFTTFLDGLNQLSWLFIEFFHFQMQPRAEANGAWIGHPSWRRPLQFATCTSTRIGVYPCRLLHEDSILGRVCCLAGETPRKARLTLLSSGSQFALAHHCCLLLRCLAYSACLFNLCLLKKRNSTLTARCCCWRRFNVCNLGNLKQPVLRGIVKKNIRNFSRNKVGAHG